MLLSPKPQKSSYVDPTKTALVGTFFKTSWNSRHWDTFASTISFIMSFRELMIFSKGKNLLPMTIESGWSLLNCDCAGNVTWTHCFYVLVGMLGRFVLYSEDFDVRLIKIGKSIVFTTKRDYSWILLYVVFTCFSPRQMSWFFTKFTAIIILTLVGKAISALTFCAFRSTL